MGGVYVKTWMGIHGKKPTTTEALSDTSKNLRVSAGTIN